MLVTSIKMRRGRNGQTEATIDAASFPARMKNPSGSTGGPLRVRARLYCDIIDSLGGGMRDRGEREAPQG